MSTDEERIYSIALTQIPGVGHIGAKRLVDGMGSATDVFRYRTELPDRLPGVNRAIVAALDSPQALKRAEQEYEFARNNRISCFTLADEDYPSRLRECDDAPVVLFFTDYGKHICVSFLQELQMQCPDVLVVSGLAYGIDINAHRSALSVELPTVGVLAHGLDRIYPSLHRKTAIDMLRQGGLLTEFLSGTNPDKHNFISRNRIVAGISDATIVVESAAKGGSLITADIAGSYHRDCFAFPGRVTDEYSKGCNQLIQDNKAVLLESASDFVKAMGWDSDLKSVKPETVQRNLFPDLSAEELRIVDILGKLGDLQINALMAQADIPINKISAILFELEMKGVIRVLAGGVYQLLR